MQLYVQALASGLASAGVLTLIALGFSIQWRALRIVNLAHFSSALLGAYLTFSLSTSTGMDPLLTLVVVVPAISLLAVLVQWLYDHFKVTSFNSLLISFALFILIEGIVRLAWGADFQSIPTAINPYSIEAVDISGIAIPTPTLIAFVISIVIAFSGAYYVRHSYFGRGLRAMAQDRDIAVAYGVNYRRTSLVIAAASGGIAGLAGTLTAMSTSLFPTAAEAWIGLVFAVVILGGIGSLTGAFVGAVLVGVITDVGTTQWGLPAAQLITFILLIIVLLWRPYGLFSKAGT